MNQSFSLPKKLVNTQEKKRRHENLITQLNNRLHWDVLEPIANFMSMSLSGCCKAVIYYESCFWKFTISKLWICGFFCNILFLNLSSRVEYIISKVLCNINSKLSVKIKEWYFICHSLSRTTSSTHCRIAFLLLKVLKLL